MIVLKQEFIKHDFKLPDHSAELSKAEDVIVKLRNKFKKIVEIQSINGKIHTELYEEIVRVLDYLGRLSNHAFNIGEELERLYVLQYPKSPQLAKRLWLNHYDSIHHPYSLLKNRCFRMLEELDEEFQKVWKKNPPNWNI